ncbi:Carboxypeptidase regulatory-like domain-containing protein [Granulicella rosea]|uniref:Carboxypeptidase regulatory-like domain-containing protein n=1 Tax=Granulicella rosea TaxID=474952 RepID=A0A239LX12_9BACT|nr:TonB-dependent receptor [Granulicella rosea]SNT34502.1 Carboxypeptidase regulatory-like domain-containing protein [Granulicella rosea]
MNRKVSFIWRLETATRFCKMLSHAWLLLLCVAVGVASASAQSTKGSILGRVSDSSDAVIPAASVELQNQGTGAVLQATTDSRGDYTFSTIDPGTYTVIVKHEGFEEAAARGIVLDVAQTIRQNIVMKIGTATEVLEITSASPVITTDSPEISTVIDSRQIENTPLDGRDTIYGLLALAPGVQRSTSNPLVAGSSFQGGTSATVDGISQNDIFNARIAGPVPSFDGIAQFTVIGSAAPARFGRAGSQVLIVTKAGGNQFHGSAFEFNRNRYLSGAGYFPLNPRPHFNRNEFGGSFGGPIIRNKLFFWATVEDLRLVQSKAIPTTQPSPEMLTGDLGPISNYLGITQMVNPNTGAQLPKDAAGLCCQVPDSAISPISKYLLGFFPKPNGGILGSGPQGCYYPTNLAPNCAAGQVGSSSITDFIYGSPTYQKNFRWSLRGDYQFSPKDHFSLRYYQVNGGPYVGPDLANAAPLFGNYSGTGTLSKNVVFNYTRIVSANIVNEFVAGYNQEHDPRESQNPQINPGALVPGVPNAPAGYGGLPTVGIYGLSGIADASSNYFNAQHIYQFNDNVTFVHGRHSMAAGAQYLRQRSGQGGSYPGSFTFVGCFSAQTCTAGAAGATENKNVAYAFADFLMGNMFTSQTQNKNNLFDATGSSYGLYVQDNWLATPRLTLNLGLRYEKTFPFGRTRGGLANFYPAMNGGAGAEVYISGQEDPNLVAAYPQPYIVNGDTVGINYNNYYKTQNLNFGPHVGFALRMNDKGTLVMRGGYALIYNYFPPFINGLGNSPPFIKATTYQQPSGTGGTNTPQLTWANPFNSTSSTGGPSVSAVEPRPKQPYNQQMNLSVEWEFIHNTALRVSYVGNLGTHLADPYPLNNPVPQPLATGLTNVQTIRPYQPWGTISYEQFNTSTNFNQFQAAIRRRFTDLTLSMDFQWSKGLGVDAFNDGGVTNPLNIRQDYGNLDYYSRLYYVFSHIYQLPVGKGKRLLRHAGTITDAVVGGWRVSGVLTLYDGLPMSASFTSIGTLGNYPSGRPNIVPGVPQILKGGSPAKTPMINIAAFCIPGECPSDGAVMNSSGQYTCPSGSTTCPNTTTEFTYGNEQRNSMYGPGFANYDASLQKEFHIERRYTFQLRLDAFNALNRTNFATPANRSISNNVAFGESTSQQGNARELQLGGRLTF